MVVVNNMVCSMADCAKLGTGVI